MLILNFPKDQFPTATRAKLRKHAKQWSQTWGVSFPQNLSVSFSPRLRVSLGSCSPHQGTIRINPLLGDSPVSLMLEVFCHELAHIAVFELFGPQTKPHGQEWKSLVTMAGFSPQRTIYINHFSANAHTQKIEAYHYRHYCPICQASRYSSRPQPRWKCAACVASGLDGKMNIESYPTEERPKS